MKRQYLEIAMFSAAACGFLLNTGAAAADSPWPLQVEMRVPFEPTEFPSGGRNYLAYELHLTNYSSDPLDVTRIEVIDPNSDQKPVAAYEGERLDELMQPLMSGAAPEPSSRRQLCGGCSAIIYMWIVFDGGAHAPSRLQHRLFTTDAMVQGSLIGTHHNELKVLAPPVRGVNWRADDGPSNDRDNHHRRGVLIIDGRTTDARRFATDWIGVENGTAFSGDPRDRCAYHAYGKPVFAVADGIVSRARDGMPENVPGHNENFKPAVAITPDTVAGNLIVLDLGGNQFAEYFHLQPGSLLVATGDHVRRGQLLARIGASGDAREPHLHFQLTDSPEVLAGQGLPYVVDLYQVKVGNKWRRHTLELPLRDELIDFGQP